VAQPVQQPAIPDLSGADLSGLSPQQNAQLKRYFAAQQAIEGNQVAGLASPIAPAPQQASFNTQESQKQQNVELNQATGPFHKIFPGTVVEAALDTALEGT
jgi:hypothetical protein